MHFITLNHTVQGGLIYRLFQNVVNRIMYVVCLQSNQYIFILYLLSLITYFFFYFITPKHCCDICFYTNSWDQIRKPALPNRQQFDKTILGHGLQQ